MRVLVSNNGRHIAALSLLVSLGLSWAVRLLAIKVSSEHGASPMEIAVTATAGIVVLLTLINIVRSKLPPVETRHLRFYALAGIFGFGAPFLLEIIVAPHLPTLLFVILVTSAPLWTAFIATILRLEPMNWLKAAGVIVGFAATAMVIFGTAPSDPIAGSQPNAAWIVTAFGIPVLYAVYVLYIAAAWPSDLDNLQGAQGQAIVALAVFAAISLTVSDRGLNIEALVSGWPISLIIVAEVAALILLFHLARNHGGSFAAQANYVAVVAGSVLGLLLFDDAATPLVAVGVVLLVLALWLSGKGRTANRNETGESAPARVDLGP